MSYFENMYGNIFLLFSAVSSAKADLTGLSILSHTRSGRQMANTNSTRKHSSRMRTARLLAVSRSIPCIPRGVEYPPLWTDIHLWTDTHL